jgi:hypothetical protein
VWQDKHKILTMKRFTKNLLFLIFFIIFYNNSFADTKLVKVTGRSVIEDNSVSIAKIRAIEDALYLASLEGGAMISGFSSVNTLSTLNEEILVRPSSGILDYDIIDEVISDQHYEVTINALLGDDNIRSNCQSRPKIRIIVYKPDLKINPHAPAWIHNLPSFIFSSFTNNLSKPENISLINATDTDFKSNLKKFNSKEFNYASLTGNIYNIEPADFALNMKIYIDVSKEEHKTLFTGPREETFLNLIVSISILDSKTGEVILEKQAKSKSFSGPSNSIIKSLNIITQPERDTIISNLNSVLIDLENDIVDTLHCLRLNANANPSKIKNAIEIDLGSYQGIKVGNLAMVENGVFPFAVFKVVETNRNSSVLQPLDKSKDASLYYGQKITFMEFENELN